MISDCGLDTADVDRDGRIDIVSSAVWYRNPGVIDGKRLFERYVYDKELAAIANAGAHDVMAADLDGNGRLSVITQHGGRKTHKALYLYKIPDPPSAQWPRTTLATVTDQHGAVAPRGIGDLNGDGRPDFVYIDRWFENRRGRVEANTETWISGAHRNSAFAPEPGWRTWTATGAWISSRRSAI